MMSLTQLRGLAFAATALAAAVGLVSRVASLRSADAALAGVGSATVAPGEAVGRGVFEGTVADGFPAGRFRVPSCEGPIFAAPIPLLSVAIEQFADGAYGKRPGYGATNVYRGGVHTDFSRLERLLVRNPLAAGGYEAKFFVRIYSPATCVVDDASLIAWANATLANFVARLPADAND